MVPTESTVFPRIIAEVGGGGNFFAPKGGDYSKEGNYLMEAIFSKFNTCTQSCIAQIHELLEVVD